MNVVVCVKQVPDPNSVGQLDPSTHTLRRDGVEVVLDPGDEHSGAYGDEVAPGLLRPRNGAGRAALVCGVLALICAIGFFLVLTIPVAIVLGLAAIVLGILGRGRVRRGLATNRGSATFGIITGLLSRHDVHGLGVSIWIAAPAIGVAAFLGGECGYLIGRTVGSRVPGFVTMWPSLMVDRTMTASPLAPPILETNERSILSSSTSRRRR